MSAQTIIILLLVGLAAGILSGLIGIGGSIIIVPALIYILGFSQKQAQGTSLGILLLPIGILAVMQYYKEGYMNVNYVVLVSLGFIVGGLIGSKLATTFISDEKLKRLFAIAMMLISIKMLFFDRKKQMPDMPQKAQTEINQSSHSAADRAT
jgi:uncharacterized membrane protein YfcA